MRPPLGALLQTSALSVATVLGTGILALPVSLRACGLAPFALLFSANLLAQLGVVAATTELLQRAYCAPNVAHYQPVDTQQRSTRSAPSLHSLAARFIPFSAPRALFELVVSLHFLFILSAYAIAAPQAYVALVPALRALPLPLLQALFVLVSALLIVVAYHALLPSLTFATIAKAIVLTALVSLTLARALAIRQPVSHSWRPSHLVDPFLMGTIALSGVVNIMPVTFQKCVDSLRDEEGAAVDAHFISAYRGATMLAVAICFVLNMLWCLAVLYVVPQSPAPHVSDAVRAAASQSVPCASLEDAYQQGQISTIPLMKVLQCRHDELDSVISLIVDVFIAVSISVSFLVMCMGMKHYIDGSANDGSQCDSDYNKSRYTRYVVYFGVVLVTALTNAHGIFRIMEGVTSLALNIEAGVFIVYMMYQSRKEEHHDVPAALSPPHAHLIYLFVGVYFALVVCIDAFYFLPLSLFTR